MSAYDELHNIARAIVLGANERGGRMTASILADEMTEKLDPARVSPSLMTYAGRSHCVQVMCRVLRSEWGTASNPVGERFTDQLQFKDFVDCLQARYPVERGGEDESAEYVPIDDLSDEEINAVCDRMEKIANKYRKHADQLRRYHRSKTAKLIA